MFEWEKQTNRSNPGFTIVELLIVVVVIAILAAITIVAYNGISQRSKVSALQSELSQAGKASEAYKVASGVEAYPATLPDVRINSPKLTYHYNSRSNTFCIDGVDDTIKYSVRSSSLVPIEGSCLENDLALWLPFNGNTTDTSGNGRTVTPTNAPTLTTGANGQANGAYYFNGADQYMTVSNADSIPAQTNNFTVATWTRGVAYGGWDYGYVALRGISTSIGTSVYWLGTNTGAPQYISGSTNGRYSQGISAVSADTSTWRHVVLVYAGGYQTVYIDGVQHVDFNIGAMTNTTTSTTLTLGGGTGGFRDLVGAIDDFRVYNRAIGASEVTALFNAGAQ